MSEQEMFEQRLHQIEDSIRYLSNTSNSLIEFMKQQYELNQKQYRLNTLFKEIGEKK